ncbi:glycoside hydrolase family 30 beta sandwich domain-containing protein [Microbacterium paraoxydans]|uniref:glycoside hydrolase family 30 beta sandwich domain-containing protein n=1 Tax=Microbacterium paraoxydans TaxID=199592 RepID=UPI001CFA26FD
MFRNTDGSMVVVMQNDSGEETPLNVMVGNRMLSTILPPDSFSTFLLAAEFQPLKHDPHASSGGGWRDARRRRSRGGESCRLSGPCVCLR